MKSYQIILSGSEANSAITIKLTDKEATTITKVFTKLNKDGKEDEYAPDAIIIEEEVQEEIPEGQLSFEDVYPELLS